MIQPALLYSLLFSSGEKLGAYIPMLDDELLFSCFHEVMGCVQKVVFVISVDGSLS